MKGCDVYVKSAYDNGDAALRDQYKERKINNEMNSAPKSDIYVAALLRWNGHNNIK